MEFYYSIEKNVHILIGLLKAHGVKKVVASPGATNVCLIESMRHDGAFEMYSSVDERSAAYIACGLAAESGEPVALTCTGATASRNYLPGLTEAFYRKLPIVAITATLHEGRLGEYYPQAIDRRILPNDVAVKSVQLPLVHTEEDAWANNLKVNQALLALRKNGGGPVHINWTTECSRDFSAKQLASQRVIRRVTEADPLPEIQAERVAVFVGAHMPMDERLTAAIDAFCERHNGVVLCDQTSNYRGKYRVLGNLITYQELSRSPLAAMPLLIHLGEVSGAYMTLQPTQVWRVSPDGQTRDYFKAVNTVFDMPEQAFFERYAEGAAQEPAVEYFEAWKAKYQELLHKIPELPFSNLWAAKALSKRLPEGSVLHLGILNSLRAWNFFETPAGVNCYSNTGGFGIDGGVSSLIGASLVHPEKLYFGIVGDLAFFYDMNSIGNRHVGNNIRLMVVNNGRGTEFRNYNHNGAIFGPEETDRFVAAAGHYGAQSRTLLKHYAQDLGFTYLSAEDEQSFAQCIEQFLDPRPADRPILLELFTDSQNESDALQCMNTLESTAGMVAKQAVKEILGEKGLRTIRKIIKR